MFSSPPPASWGIRRVELAGRNIVFCEFVLPELLFARFGFYGIQKSTAKNERVPFHAYFMNLGNVQSPHRAHLPEEGSATRLDSLNLGHVERLVTEAGRQLRGVEEDARGRLD